MSDAVKVSPASADSAAAAYLYQRDRRSRTSQEAQRLDDAAKLLRNKLEGIAKLEKSTFKAFEAVFEPLRVTEHEGHDWDYPHCDQWVLHAPGKCEYCDMCPEAQARRVEIGVCFTGAPEDGKCPCPSELLRGIDVINHWPGNRPAAKE